MIRIISAALLLALTACTTGGHNYESYLTRHNLPAPTAEHFPHCRAYGCQKQDQLALSTKDWAEITALFANVTSAAQEREKLKPAIALFEQKTGAQNGTATDKGGTFSGVGQNIATQHDCVDESINTTIYLALLAKNGLLHFHDVNAPVSRTPVTTLASGKLWPHQSAVITDRQTGTHYVVDSWFHDNGQPAEIAPLATWLKGWSPEKAQ